MSSKSRALTRWITQGLVSWSWTFIECGRRRPPIARERLRDAADPGLTVGSVVGNRSGADEREQDLRGALVDRVDGLGVASDSPAALLFREVTGKPLPRVASSTGSALRRSAIAASQPSPTTDWIRVRART